MENLMTDFEFGHRSDGGEKQRAGSFIHMRAREAAEKHEIKNLVDVLFAIKASSVGDPIVIEESNRHLLLKIICREKRSEARDEYIKEFTAAVMQKSARYPGANISIIFRGTGQDNFLILKALW